MNSNLLDVSNLDYGCFSKYIYNLYIKYIFFSGHGFFFIILIFQTSTGITEVMLFLGLFVLCTNFQKIDHQILMDIRHIQLFMLKLLNSFNNDFKVRNSDQGFGIIKGFLGRQLLHKNRV